MRIKLLKHEIGVKLRTILIKNALDSKCQIGHAYFILE